MPVQQELVSGDQKRPRAARGVNDSNRCGLGDILAGKKRFKCRADDVIHDEGGGVVNATGFPNLRLLFYLDLVPMKKNRLPEILLVSASENVGTKYRKLVWALRVVHAVDDLP